MNITVLVGFIYIQYISMCTDGVMGITASVFLTELTFSFVISIGVIYPFQCILNVKCVHEIGKKKLL